MFYRPETMQIAAYAVYGINSIDLLLIVIE